MTQINMKKIVALILTVVMAAALMGNAAAKTAAFPDIYDAGLARDVAVLQMLGVVSGDENGNFGPSGTLTRAQFCKMAVMAMGKGDQAALYKSRTIFPDVRATYWARGYINYAVSGEKKLIIGNSDGTFTPESPVTYAQAVTILLRMLGYADADAGMLWPDGYLALAGDTGLAEGVSLAAPAAPVTRADAARLFVNLLGTAKKEGGLFAASLGTTVPNAVIMELDVTASDGSAGAVRASTGILKPAGSVVPAGILGLHGTLVLDTSGKLLTIVPDAGRQITITVGSVSAAWLKDVSGTQYNVKADTPTYTAAKNSTYGIAFADIAPGMSVTLYYGGDGAVSSVFINTSQSDAAYVVGASSTGTYSALTGGDTDYKIYKNGALAASSDITQYDVLTYDKSARILNVSDFRLTGCYEASWPNMENPSKITLMGHEFKVLPSAAASLSRFKVGQVVTFLFTNDLQVAGAEANVPGLTAIGIVQSGISATSATVKFLNGLTLSGNPQTSSENAAALNGELVTVYSTGAGKLGLSRVNNSNASGVLDVKNRTLGSYALSTAAKIFERVGKGPVTQIALSDLTQTKIDAAQVLYAGTDGAGRVNTLILNDVTGDRYIYGIMTGGTTTISGGDSDYITQVISVKNSANASGTAPVLTDFLFTNQKPGGIALSTDGQKAEKLVTLKEETDVKRSAFYTRGDKTYLLIDGVEYPVATDVQCYNSLTESWFKTLDEARAFAETMKVYYDRNAADGGKIRMVMVG